MRIYETRIQSLGDGAPKYIVCVDGGGKSVEVEVSSALYEEIIELQREIWRLDKRESRHCVHLEAIPDCFLPHERMSADPESKLIEKLEGEIIVGAIMQLPAKQRRRFALRHACEWPIRKIAQHEGCTERSIKYSLSLAKKNLQDILSEDFPYAP